MNKKGFLLGEETLKIIVAVICLGFLVYFLTSLYFSNSKSQELEEAELILLDSSESISSVIERVRNGEGNLEDYSQKIEVHNPDGWHVFGFATKLPNVCAGKNCVCICKSVWFDTLLGMIESRQLNECIEEGVCLIVEDLEEKDFDVKIKKPTTLLIKYNKEVVKIEEWI